MVTALSRSVLSIMKSHSQRDEKKSQKRREKTLKKSTTKWRGETGSACI
jgi:hypothetical protein